MKKFDLYILDFDGTIINSFEGLKIFYRAIFKEVGCEVSDEDCIYFTKISLQEAFLYKVKTPTPELIEKFRNKCDEVVESGILLDHNVPYEDTLPFINYVKDNNIKCGIVTGNDTYHVNKVFNNLNIKDFTSFIIGSYDLKKQKPDPEGILLALERNNMLENKKNVCYIGDAYNDFLAAKRAGVVPILIDRNHELEESDEYIVIHDLMDLFND